MARSLAPGFPLFFLFLSHDPSQPQHAHTFSRPCTFLYVSWTAPSNETLRVSPHVTSPPLSSTSHLQISLSALPLGDRSAHSISQRSGHQAILHFLVGLMDVLPMTPSSEQSTFSCFCFFLYPRTQLRACRTQTLRNTGLVKVG